MIRSDRYKREGKQLIVLIPVAVVALNLGLLGYVPVLTLPVGVVAFVWLQYLFFLNCRG